MTSWQRGGPSRVLSLCCVAFAGCAEASSGGARACWSPSVTSCTDCLQRGPQCAWCFQEDFSQGAEQNRRCGSPEHLRSKGCRPEFMEQSDIKVEADATSSSTQVSPREIYITLRPGSEASFIVAVKQSERYPVDLYYSVDVSASMQENLNHLKTVGVASSLRMTQHTSDLWSGFGSFVDKPVSPYINVHPSKIDNPCSEYQIHCRPAHGFHHVLSMTDNISEFTRVMKQQRISGNLDTPEGGSDAMSQAAICQRAVGWRPEAKRLLLSMTDQPSHLASDSRSGGIVTPHDGRCHMENNIYTGTTRMDHPSLGQSSDKSLENHIYPIFAVEKNRYQWYEELVKFLPGSFSGKLGLFQAPNLIDSVVDAYKRLSSEVAVSVSLEDKAVSRYSVSVSPLCPHGSTAKDQSCSGVQPGQTVYFNITVRQHSCADNNEDEDVTMLVRPVGYNESALIKIHSKCQCKCGPMGRCNGNDQSLCGGSQHGVNQEQRPAHGHMKDSSSDPNRDCKADGSNTDCSGRGVCECGKCVCEQSRLGMVYGKYCEIDDFSCPYEKGQMCGGQGVCVSGECVCEDGWTGDSCGCPTSKTNCQSPNGLLCSDSGKCVCGKCVCDDPRRSGDFCERCPTCQLNQQSPCKSVACHHSQALSQKEAELCNTTCAFHVGSLTDVSDRVSSGRSVGTFSCVCASTVSCGLVMVAVSRLLLQRRGLPQGDAVVDLGYTCTGKDLSYIPTTNEKTVTYRRDRPPAHLMEMHIQVPKMPLDDHWQF